jgi:tetratricopeptide (TPR) repeat protein
MKKGVACFCLLYLGLLVFGWVQAYRAWMLTSAAITINEDAFVYVLRVNLQHDDNVSGFQYKGLSVGFAVGDGRYIVTAAHCVSNLENSRSCLYYPSVISPYYGDIIAAEIVAIDLENDIAVLKPAWDVHPALQLEASDVWKRESKLVMATYPPPDEKYGGSGNISHTLLTETASRITLVTPSGQVKPNTISVGSVRFPGPGWSGSPFIVPETGNVAGLMSIVGTEKGRFNSIVRYSSGPDVDAIRQLFEAHSLGYESTGLSAPAMNRKEEFKQILSFFDELTKDHTQAPGLITQMCADFPDSLMLYVLAGYFLDEPNLPTDYYQKLANRAPESPFAYAACGALRRFKKKDFALAAKDFGRAAELDPDNLFAHYGHLQMLVDTDPNTAVAMGQDLIARWPQEASFWFEYARALRIQNRRSEELPVIQKAVELAAADKIPYLYHRYLADSLAANGHNAAAEEAYEMLLKTHLCDRCRDAYAGFLENIGKPERAEQVRLKATPNSCSH